MAADYPDKLLRSQVQAMEQFIEPAAIITYLSGSGVYRALKLHGYLTEAVMLTILLRLHKYTDSNSFGESNGRQRRND